MPRLEPVRGFRRFRLYWDKALPALSILYADMAHVQESWIDRWPMPKQQAIRHSLLLDQYEPGKTYCMVKREVAAHTGSSRPRGIQPMVNLGTQARTGPRSSRFQKSVCELFRGFELAPGIRCTISSGMNSDDISLWANQVILGKTEYWVYERDAKSFDATLGRKHHNLVQFCYRSLDPTLADWMEESYVTKGYVKRTDVRYTAVGTTRSGFNGTTIGNSIVNLAIIVESMVACGYTGDVIVVGDDCLVVSECPLDAGRLARLERNYGIEPVSRVFRDITDSSYTSALFVPTRNGLRFCPKPGRVMARLWWTVKPPGDKKLEQYRWSVRQCLSLMHTMPVVRSLLLPLREPRVVNTGYMYWVFRGCQEAFDDVTMDWFCERYATVPSEVREVECLLAKYAEQRVFISHPLIDRMMDLDNADLSDRTEIHYLRGGHAKAVRSLDQSRAGRVTLVASLRDGSRFRRSEYSVQSDSRKVDQIRHGRGESQRRAELVNQGVAPSLDGVLRINTRPLPHARCFAGLHGSDDRGGPDFCRDRGLGLSNLYASRRHNSSCCCLGGSRDRLCDGQSGERVGSVPTLATSDDRVSAQSTRSPGNYVWQYYVWAFWVAMLYCSTYRSKAKVLFADGVSRSEYVVRPGYDLCGSIFRVLDEGPGCWLHELQLGGFRVAAVSCDGRLDPSHLFFQYSCVGSAHADDGPLRCGLAIPEWGILTDTLDRPGDRLGAPTYDTDDVSGPGGRQFRDTVSTNHWGWILCVCAAYRGYVAHECREPREWFLYTFVDEQFVQWGDRRDGVWRCRVCRVAHGCTGCYHPGYGESSYHNDSCVHGVGVYSRCRESGRTVLQITSRTSASYHGLVLSMFA